MVTRGHGATRGQRKGALDGGNIWWIAPTFSVASDIWRDLKQACNNAWTDKSEIEKRIELPGGGAVTVKSSDNPDSLRGAGLDGVVIDEAATTKQDAWQQSLRPALSDKQGWAAFIGTPKGFNWFHDLYVEAEHLPDWERWRRPSSDNPLMTAEELVQARREVGGLIFAQEYEATFQADSFGMFRRDWFRVVQALPDNPSRVVRAWDMAATEGAGDYSAGCLMMKLEDGGYCIGDLIRGQWSVGQRDRIIQQTAAMDAHRWKKYMIVLEQEPGSSGVSATEYLIRQLSGYNARGAKATGEKDVRAQPLSAQCEIGNVSLLQAEWTREFVDELVMFPEGRNDDQVDAASGAFNELAKPKRKAVFA